tara:strand:+ start:2572 stop:2958 length:387 start_codon:yes stop_codon:yes gene_type:complete
MATITPRKIVEGGLAESLSTCATGGDEFLNSGIEFLHIVNDHASVQYTITVTAQTTSIRHPSYGIVTKANQEINVAAGAEAFMGPFKQGAFNDANNKVQITYKVTSDSSAIGSGAHLLKIEVLYLDNQ